MSLLHRSVSRSDRSTAVDVLRGIAIFWVILHHVARGPWKGWVPAIAAEGWTGVDLFFVISGFLVTRSLSKALVGASDGSEWDARALGAGRYVVRRFLRILPLAWLWAAVPLLASHFCNASGAFGEPESALREFLAVVGFRYNYFAVSTGIAHFSHFWSLAVEEHFYLFLPLFLLLVRDHGKRTALLAGLVLACIIARIIARASGENFGALNFLTHFRADGLAWGCIIGLQGEARLERCRRWMTSRFSAVALKAAFGVSMILLWTLPALQGRDAVSYWGFTLFGFLSALLVTSAATHAVALPFPTLMVGALAALGRRSYSLYLIHVPVLMALIEFKFRIWGLARGTPWESPAGAALEGLVFAAMTGVLVEASYRWMEEPLSNLLPMKK